MKEELNSEPNYVLENDILRIVFLPYFGVWITRGGLEGSFNCALEPASGFYDSVSKAMKNNAVNILKPKEKLDFDLEIRLN